MHIYDHTWLMPSVAQDRRRIAGYGIYDGWIHNTGRYAERCKAFHQPTGTLMIFTRDAGMHASGWWKNPEYERCLHLSLSFRDVETGDRAPRNKKLTGQWLDYFFGDNKRMLWCEPPFSPEGKQCDTWHYRLFCAPNWTPIIPRGEVYSKEFTEMGWKSFSDVQAELHTDAARVAEMLADASAHQAAE